MASPVQKNSPAGAPRQLASVLHRNIDVLKERKRQDSRALSVQEKAAEAVTRFAGSVAFVYLHIAIYGVWTAWNLGFVPGAKAFDPTFVVLATVASVEGIFLGTFILISQNRAAAEADRRADLNLHVNLLAEHEVTRLLTLLEGIARKLGANEVGDLDLTELKKDVAPEVVLDKLDHEADQES